MKKLLFAVCALACAVAAAIPASAQVLTYTDTAPTGERIQVPVTPNKPAPVACISGCSGSSGSLSATVNVAHLSGLTDASSHALSITAYGGQRVVLQSPIDGTDLDPGADSFVVLHAGTAIAGKFGIDQTTPGTTDSVTLKAGATIQEVPATSGGLLGFHFISAASDNHQSVGAAGAHQLYTIDATSIDATAHYLRIYDSGAAFNGCNSATGLIWGDIVPAAAAGAGIVKEWTLGRPVTSGIAVCLTKAGATIADTDTTSATAGTVAVNLGYK